MSRGPKPTNRPLGVNALIDDSDPRRRLGPARRSLVGIASLRPNQPREPRAGLGSVQTGGFDFGCCGWYLAVVRLTTTVCAATAALLWVLWGQAAPAAQVYRLATYNLDNYLLKPAGGRPAKSAEARAKIRESLRALQADVVALQEVGGPEALAELRQALEAEGLRYSDWELVAGFDTNIHVAVLSRLPIVARRPHTNETFLWMGRRFHVSRGFLEVDIQVNPHYTLTLFSAHLKSRRVVPEADEADLRQQEALLLRQKIDARLATNPSANLVVLGDLNDLKDSRTLRILRGRGRTALLDTRPAERNGDTVPAPGPGLDPRQITWTFYYGKEDTYSRIDYILISPGLVPEWLPEQTYVLALPNWGLASDHRPIVAGFLAEDRPPLHANRPAN